MKNKTKALSAIALGLLVVLGASIYASGGALQGKFSLSGMNKYPAPTLTLSPSSPGGDHSTTTVGLLEDVMTIRATAGTVTKSTIPVGSVINFTFKCSSVVVAETGNGTVKDSIGTATSTLVPLTVNLETIGCIDSAVSGEAVSLMGSTSVIATGLITFVDDFTATVAVTFNGALEIDPGVPQDLVLSLDSYRLITDNSAANDKLTITATYKSQTVTGNVLTY